MRTPVAGNRIRVKDSISYEQSQIHIVSMLICNPLSAVSSISSDYNCSGRSG